MVWSQILVCDVTLLLILLIGKVSYMALQDKIRWFMSGVSFRVSLFWFFLGCTLTAFNAPYLLWAGAAFYAVCMAVIIAIIMPGDWKDAGGWKEAVSLVPAFMVVVGIPMWAAETVTVTRVHALWVWMVFLCVSTVVTFTEAWLASDLEDLELSFSNLIFLIGSSGFGLWFAWIVRITHWGLPIGSPGYFH